MDQDEIKARVLAALRQGGATASTARQVMERANSDPSAPKIESMRDVTRALIALHGEDQAEFVAPQNDMHGTVTTIEMRAKKDPTNGR